MWKHEWYDEDDDEEGEGEDENEARGGAEIGGAMPPGMNRDEL